MGKCFHSFVSVHRVHTTNDDSYVYTHLSPLAMDSIEQAQGYRFDRENQEIYLSRDLLEFILRCQWPEIQLPIPQAGPPPQTPQPSVYEELMRGLQATHDSTVDMLCTQVVNPCQVYQEKDASTILANIRPQQVNCPFCHRVCKTTQKLKSHIRSHHLKAAVYKFPISDKSCGDPYSLKQHKKALRLMAQLIKFYKFYFLLYFNNRWLNSQ